MPIFRMVCPCGSEEDMLMKYDEMVAGVTCECGKEMRNQIMPSAINDFGSGPSKRAMAPPVGPNDKRSKAYEKKMDDESSMECNKPGGTFGTGGVKGFKERQVKIKQAEAGKTDFTNG